MARVSNKNKLVKIWGVYPKIPSRNLSTLGQETGCRISQPRVDSVQNLSTPG